MKQLIAFFSVFFLMAVLNAQTIVPTEPENKNVVLEEFTGLHCGYCPQGHQVAHQILSSHPDDVSVIAVHTGGYANPGTGEPDYRTQWGAAIAGQTGLIGYPAGTVNRHVFSNLNPSATALNRGQWLGASNQIMNQPSYLNIEANATIVSSSRQLSVLVEVYYTDDSPVDMNYLNLALIQDNVVGPQAGGGSNYTHMHMLRDLLTGQWGIPIQTTTGGSFYTTTVNYSIPEDIRGVDVVLENLHVIAFVTESHQEIVSGNPAEINTISGVDTDASINTVTHLPETYCGGELSPSVEIKNFGSNNLTAVMIEYAFNNESAATYEWTGNLATNETVMVDLPAFTPAQILEDNTLTVQTNMPNGIDDELPGNDIYVANIDKCIYATQECKLAFYIPDGADEVSWKLVSETGEVVISAGPYENTGVHQHPFSFPAEGIYTFILEDAGGDAFGGTGFIKLFTLTKGVVWEADMDAWTSSLVTQFTYDADGVSDIEVIANESLYPNPASNVAHLSYILNETSDVKIEVYDALGKMVKQEVLLQQSQGAHQYDVQVSDLENGLYIVNIHVNKTILSQKLNVLK